MSVQAVVPKPARARGGARTFTELEERVRELGASEFLVESLIPVRSLVLMAGRSGVGKSPLIYQLLLSVAGGVPFLGMKTKKGRVLYLDYENGLGQVAGIARSISRHLGLPEVPDDVRFWSLNDCDSSESTPEGIRKLICLERPALVVIDSLSGYQPEVEEKNSIATSVIQELRGVIRETGSSILLVHHLRKLSDDPKRCPPSLEAGAREWFNQVRGASALVNASDVRLGFETPPASGGVNADLRFGGFARVQGDIPLRSLQRVFDKDEPCGYELLRGASLLPMTQEQTFRGLPSTFTFKEAKARYGKSDQPTIDFLRKCMSLRILEQRKKGGRYEKVDPED